MAKRGPGAVRNMETRGRILRATRDLVANVGYEKMTMEGVAAAAHVGKQTVYRWWPSKSALLAECVEDGLILPRTSTVHGSGDLRANLLSWLQDVMSYLREPGNSSVLRGLAAASADDAALGALLYAKMAAPLGSRIAFVVESGRAKGQVRPEVSSSYVIEMFFGIILYRLLTRLEVGPEQAEEIVQIILRGIEPSN